MVSRIIPVEDFDLVIFGATGDLARRKIVPGLFRRFLAGQISDDSQIIGAARTRQTDEEFRADMRAALLEFVGEQPDPGRMDQFLNRLGYVAVDAKGVDGWSDLKARIRPQVVHAFYFSVAPSLFGPIAERLAQHGLADGQSRIVVEKPFGRDLATARELNATLARHFTERQIYRIDHYLGKETVQNLMAVRFANILFEPLWNAQYVDHVQITVAETVGVGGRGEYYDHSGAMRDMVQNHLMQLLCLIAMEPPYHIDSDAVRDEKLKVIRALEPVAPEDIVRGQYLEGPDGPGYLQDAENPESRTESFVALKVRIANWRWTGTPFYLRTGKRLRARTSEIVITFKEPPHSLFDDGGTHKANQLVIKLQPNEGMHLSVMIKEPGPGGMRLVQVPLDMSFADALGPEGTDMPDAYERLIMDVIRGNQTLFMRGDEVEAAWAWTDPIIAAWEGGSARPEPYDPGSSGPEEALRLLHRDNRRWREIRP
ncbi:MULTISPECIES: glucose-6-phosphate dehydrogenase [unclassified Paracoccus (in: a-proteobacteria)]|uniref:glucose-6-phosphate dehydrogenase n=1 Tax=unclassified Paracoccus (in: a-proteobacteria) TaxID=2688777 RepID=UPI0012B37BDE|nr:MULTISPECIES: glucose-6-phosphate dehydrogenase [unclassified Paracoccus (in: a-proteobacteria)]UXU73939.1 glucose-6-phosphate dehydrogenase [Paracoccus sp. SMMA_5]UXU79826.1 glucose-6-phosphate dehydrogenase [Paracoccus sp. SMMA_5_TC]